MIKGKLTNLKRESKVHQQASLRMQEVAIKEYFPQTNTVTVTVLTSGQSSTVKSRSGDRQYPLGYRSDVTETSPPQVGDRGMLISNGWQNQMGFVLLTHSNGGESSRQYIPIRGSWAI